MANVLHSSLTTTDLHEPKGVAAASSGQVYVANGGGSGAWTTLTSPVFMNKHIAGLTWSNAADASNDITVLAGTARDTTNTEDMTLAASITKRIDATWVVGDNQGGLDTGAVANTTYHMYLIKRVDTGVVDVLFSTSASAPTMPTNYTKKRRIGSFTRNSGVNQPVTVVENEGGGIDVFINPVETDCDSIFATGTNFTITRLPTGVRFKAFIAALSDSTSTVNERFLITAPDVSLSSLSSTIQNVSMGGGITGATSIDAESIPYRVGGSFAVVSNTSGQIKIASSQGVNYTMSLCGWTDFRRD